MPGFDSGGIFGYGTVYGAQTYRGKITIWQNVITIEKAEQKDRNPLWKPVKNVSIPVAKTIKVIWDE